MIRLLTLFLCFSHHLLIGQDLSLEKSKGLFEDGNYANAKSILLAIKKSSSAFGEAQYYLGRIATIEKNYPLAVDYFEKAVKTDSSVAEYHNWLGVLYGVVAMDANPIKQAWLAPKIKNEFEKAAAIDPANIQTQWGLLHYYTKAPGFLGGSWKKALDCVKTLEKLNKAQGLCARGFVYEKEGDLVNAKIYYQNSLKLEPVKEAQEGLVRISY